VAQQGLKRVSVEAGQKSDQHTRERAGASRYQFATAETVAMTAMIGDQSEAGDAARSARRL